MTMSSQIWRFQNGILQKPPIKQRSHSSLLLQQKEWRYHQASYHLEPLSINYIASRPSHPAPGLSLRS
jgi:hypothetical protein